VNSLDCINNLNVTVSSKTLRPFYRIGTSTWKDEAVKVNGEMSGQISVFALYIRYCEEKKEYPNEEQFVRFCYSKLTNSIHSKSTVPAQIREMYRFAVEKYQKIRVFEKYTVQQFLKIANKARKGRRSREDRERE
jgi:hypothetical protein